MDRTGDPMRLSQLNSMRLELRGVNANISKKYNLNQRRDEEPRNWFSRYMEKMNRQFNLRKIVVDKAMEKVDLYLEEK